MPQIFYQIVSGTEKEVEEKLAGLNAKGPAQWQPLLMSAVMAPEGPKLFVLAEHKK